MKSFVVILNLIIISHAFASNANELPMESQDDKSEALVQVAGPVEGAVALQPVAPLEHLSDWMQIPTYLEAKAYNFPDLMKEAYDHLISSCKDGENLEDVERLLLYCPHFVHKTKKVLNSRVSEKGHSLLYLAVRHAKRGAKAPAHFHNLRSRIGILRSIIAAHRKTGVCLIDACEDDEIMSFASLHGHKDMVALLLDAGISVNHPDELGWTALHNAMANYGHSYDMALMLIGRGANVNARDDKHRTPLDILMSRDGICDDGAATLELLLQNKALSGEAILQQMGFE